MPIWKTQPVSRQPELTLRPWRVQELSDGDRHLVGYCTENGEGRVSSRVEAFDPARRRVETRTGRIYRLEGPPGVDLDAEYVWNSWAAAYALTETRDVSDEVYRAIRTHADKEQADPE